MQLTYARKIAVLAGLFALAALTTSFAGPQDPIDGNRVQCANLVYAVNKSSVCFSDRFLKRLEMETKVLTEDRFARVRADNATQLANYPFAIMTGEGGFTL